MRLWLKERREAAGMTQDQVAKKADICRSYYTMIENGKYNIPPKTAMKIAMALEFDWTLFYKKAG